MRALRIDKRIIAKGYFGGPVWPFVAGRHPDCERLICFCFWSKAVSTLGFLSSS